MKQTRTMSMIEALTNVAVGFWIAMATQALVFPVFGLHAAPAQHFGIAAIFTMVSLLRSFALRRVFERLQNSPDMVMVSEASLRPAINSVAPHVRTYRATTPARPQSLFCHAAWLLTKKPAQCSTDRRNDEP